MDWEKLEKLKEQIDQGKTDIPEHTPVASRRQNRLGPNEPSENRSRERPMSEWLACKNCGHIGGPKEFGIGDWIGGIFITICLLFVFILPGIIFFAFFVSRTKRCALCNDLKLIPLNSPEGRKLLEAFQKDKEGGQR